MADGELVTADLYIAATGVKPNVSFLAGSGVAHEWGITVDDHLRTTAPGIWAAGDVVEAPDRATGEAYVHAIFPNAVDQARVVAANMLGGDVAYAGAESMNSLKHLGLPIMAVGAMEGAGGAALARGRRPAQGLPRTTAASWASGSRARSPAVACCGRSCSGARTCAGSGARLVVPGFGIGRDRAAGGRRLTWTRGLHDGAPCSSTTCGASCAPGCPRSSLPGRAPPTRTPAGS